MIAKAQENKKKDGPHQNQKFCASKDCPLKRDNTPWAKKQPTDWEKISANHVSDKKQLNNKDTKQPDYNMGKVLDISPEKIDK